MLLILDHRGWSLPRACVGSSMRPSKFSASCQACVGGRSATVEKSRSSRLINTRSSAGL